MKGIFTIVILIFTVKVFSQTATVKVVGKDHDNQYDKFDNIHFEFNGLSFSGRDKGDHKIKLNDGFDEGVAIIGVDTLHFKLKFKPGQSYTIRPGCCCATFTLTADLSPNRGTIQVNNRTKRDLTLVIAEANWDTIRANSTNKPVFAFESAMCLFKPASILITELEYGNKKYQYKAGAEVDYKKTLAERNKFILSKSWFHFLHGEKIEITFDEKASKVSYRLNGYLEPEEVEKYYNH